MKKLLLSIITLLLSAAFAIPVAAMTATYTPYGVPDIDSSFNKTVKLFGSANVYMPLNGKIAKIEQIKFE